MVIFKVSLTDIGLLSFHWWYKIAVKYGLSSDKSPVLVYFPQMNVNHKSIDINNIEKGDLVVSY